MHLRKTTPVVSTSNGSLPVAVFDERAHPNMNALAIASNGSAFGSIVRSLEQSRFSRGVGVIVSYTNGLELTTDLTEGPRISVHDAHVIDSESGPAVGAGVVRSASGTTVLMIAPDSGVDGYRIPGYGPVVTSRVDPRRAVVAVDDQATWYVTDDGWLQSTQPWLFSVPPRWSFPARIPLGFTSAGYALSGDGKFALVYAYRLTSESGNPRAHDPRLFLFDLRRMMVDPSSPTLSSYVELPDAVGCNTVPLPASEVCEHHASITLLANNDVAIVLGPRGIAAVSIPAMPPSPALSSKEQPKPISKSLPIKTWLWKPDTNLSRPITPRAQR
jgi:hypothetical protein